MQPVQVIGKAADVVEENATHGNPPSFAEAQGDPWHGQCFWPQSGLAGRRNIRLELVNSQSGMAQDSPSPRLVQVWGHRNP